MMMTRIQIGVFVFVVALVWATSALLHGVNLDTSHLIPFFSVVSATPILLMVFDRWAWKFGIFKYWLVRRPLIDGTWKGQLTSNYKTKDQPYGMEIEVIVVIRQLYSDVSVRMYTKESSSRSSANSIEENDEGMFCLSYIYQNDPATLLRGERSEIHYGATVLHFCGLRPTEGAGEYWTGRLTKGAIKLSRHSSIRVSSFDTGQELFQSRD